MSLPLQFVFPAVALNIMAFSIVTLSTTAFSIMALGITKMRRSAY